MLVPLLTVVLAAPAAPATLALPGLSGVNLGSGEAALYSDLLAAELARSGLKVITNRDIAAVLGLERQKAVMSCAEASCTAELAAALGADGLVVGDIGKLGATTLLNVKVLSAKSAASEALYTEQVPKVDDVPRALKRAASSLASQLAVAWNRPELARASEPAPTPSGDRRLWALAPAIVGVAGLGVGLFFEVQAEGQLASLKALTPPVDLAHAQQLRNAGKGSDTVGALGLAVGTVGLAAAAALFVTLGPADAKVAAALAPGGGAVVVGGSFP